MEDVKKLRGSLRLSYTLADKGARRRWKAMDEKPFVRSLGALTGGQAVQMVRAGLEAIYCSGWQVAADANTAAQTFPDQSLYPADSVPKLVKRSNNDMMNQSVEACLQNLSELPPIPAELRKATIDINIVMQL